MSSHYEAPIRKPLVTGNKSYHDVSVDIAAAIEGKANKQWWIVFSIALVAFLWGVGCMIYTISTGIGVWGLNKTVGWAWDITNFVWWIGIGHAGTLISAVLNKSVKVIPLAEFVKGSKTTEPILSTNSTELTISYTDV